MHTFGTAFLGLTLECTRCHDHKYDPVTQKDYFSLSAFFNNIDEAGLYSISSIRATPTHELGDLPSDEKIRQAEANLEKVLKSEEAKQAFTNWKKKIQVEIMGRATYFSKALPPIEKTEKNLDVLSLKPSLWLDASDLNQTASNWHDKSGNENDAKKHASPKVVTHNPSGMKVMKYHSKSNDYHQFEEIKNIRTVFWVMSKTAGNSGSPLCHSSAHHFYSNGNKFWHPQHTHQNIRNGSLSINGLEASSYSNYPNSLAVVSLRTTGDVTASRLGRDRNHGGNYNWNGEFGEVLIFSEALSNENVRRIEIIYWKNGRSNANPKSSGRSSRLPLVRRTGRKPVPQRSQPRKGRQHQRKQQGSGREARKRDSIHRGRRPEFPIRIRRLQPSPILQHGFLGKADPIARPGGHRPPLRRGPMRQPGYEVLIEDGRLSRPSSTFGRATPFASGPKTASPSMNGPMSGLLTTVRAGRRA